jgi:hypothetical protein
MASKLNATRHRANWMPAAASLDQQIAWHLAHARACACRTVPANILEELKRRGVRVPVRGRPEGPLTLTKPAHAMELGADPRSRGEMG